MTSIFYMYYFYTASAILDKMREVLF